MRTAPIPLLLIAALVVVVLVWTYSRALGMVEQWAQDNGYQIIDCEHRFLRTGPFFWSSSKNQIVYYVKMRDRMGAERAGWVRCGGYWWGIFSAQTEVRWQD